jgi:hypothetical protein
MHTDGGMSGRSIRINPEHVRVAERPQDRDDKRYQTEFVQGGAPGRSSVQAIRKDPRRAEG